MRFPCLRASLYALNGMDCKDSSALATALILFLAVALELRRRTPALRGAQRDDIAVVGAAAHGWLRLREFGSVPRPPPTHCFFLPRRRRLSSSVPSVAHRSVAPARRWGGIHGGVASGISCCPV